MYPFLTGIARQSIRNCLASKPIQRLITYFSYFRCRRISKVKRPKHWTHSQRTTCSRIKSYYFFIWLYMSTTSLLQHSSRLSFLWNRIFYTPYIIDCQQFIYLYALRNLRLVRYLNLVIKMFSPQVRQIYSVKAPSRQGFNINLTTAYPTLHYLAWSPAATSPSWSVLIYSIDHYCLCS